MHNKVILIGGAPMVGKSTVARKLTARLEYGCLSTDDLGQAIAQVITAHATWGDPAVVEGWALYPSLVAQLALPNIDTPELTAALQYNNLAFPYIVTSEDCRAYKPHPAPFLRALERLGLAPHEVVHIGDSLGSDIRGAQALGIPAIWVNRTGRALPEGCAPEYVTADLDGLLQLFDNKVNERVC